MRNGPHTLWYLNTASSASGVAWGGYGTFRKCSHAGGSTSLRVGFYGLWPHSTLMLCFRQCGGEIWPDSFLFLTSCYVSLAMVDSSTRDPEAKINCFACGHGGLSQLQKQLINPFSLVNSTMMKYLWRMGLAFILYEWLVLIMKLIMWVSVQGGFFQVFVYSFFYWWESLFLHDLHSGLLASLTTNAFLIWIRSGFHSPLGHVEVSALATFLLLSSHTMTTVIYRSSLFRLPVLESRVPQNKAKA